MQENDWLVESMFVCRGLGEDCISIPINPPTTASLLVIILLLYAWYISNFKDTPLNFEVYWWSKSYIDTPLDSFGMTSVITDIIMTYLWRHEGQFWCNPPNYDDVFNGRSGFLDFTKDGVQM